MDDSSDDGSSSDDDSSAASLLEKSSSTSTCVVSFQVCYRIFIHYLPYSLEEYDVDLKELRHDILSCFFFFGSLKIVLNWKENFK